MIRIAPVVSIFHTMLRPLALLLSLAGCAALLPPYTDIPEPPASSLPQASDAFVLPDGTKLPVRAWLPPDGRPPRAVILALHGFNDSRDAFELPGPVFAQAGIAVFAPDQRGFGAAPGRGVWPSAQVLVNDAAAMLRLLHRRYPEARLFAMGESMGGAVLMALSASPDAPPVDGWVLAAPAVWGRVQMGVALSSGLWLASSAAPGMHVTGNEVAIRVTPSDNRAALIRLARDPLTIRRTRFDALRGLVDLMDTAQAAAPHLAAPTLVLYGEKDDIVPAAATARVWSDLPPGTRRALYPNGYHLLMRDKGRAAVIGDVIAWIDDPAGWLPSGADSAAASWRATHH